MFRYIISTTRRGFFLKAVLSARVRPSLLKHMRLYFGSLQAGIDRFAFQGQDPEDAFVDATQRFPVDKALQGFDAECEFSDGEGAFGRDVSLAETLQVFGGSVFGAVNDAQIFGTSAFDGGLNEAVAAVLGDEGLGFDDHSLFALRSEVFPPGGG